MKRYTLYIPEQMNDGRMISPSLLDEIEDSLLALTRGFTCTRGQGAWLGEGDRIYREPVRLYATDSENPAMLSRLEKLARELRVTLQQEAIYLTHQEIGVSLVS
jgi:hypothetical protein